MVRVRKMCHCSFHLKFPSVKAALGKKKEKKKKAPLAGIVHVNPKLSTVQAFPGVTR